MIAFVAFVYFGSFLLDYCFRLYHALPPSPRRRNVKIGIWTLISGIMFGFACELMKKRINTPFFWKLSVVKLRVSNLTQNIIPTTIYNPTLNESLTTPHHTTMTPSPLLPIATSDDAHAPNLRVLLPYFLGFLSTTISCGIITYLAYTKKRHPHAPLHRLHLRRYFSVDFSPTITHQHHHPTQGAWPPRQNRDVGVAERRHGGVRGAFSTLLTLPESLCYFWVVLGGSALLFQRVDWGRQKLTRF
ncbi:hypothetical protein E2542_SST27757 [Spatholobus suberectus]|nr:hypothetical protein E2542_SST27757 [Spatholobus suberectus]